MISTLINLLGSFYESKDFTRAESIAHSIHTAIPGDLVSLKFLGLVYYRTGRINEAMRLFDQVEGGPGACPSAESAARLTVESTVESAVVACAREASLRVPYLTTAWRDLGNVLLKFRKFQRSPQVFSNSLFASPVFA